MSTAESWLILGGLFNLFATVVVGYALYWVRLRDPVKPAQPYALIAHKLILWNGLILLALATVIERTGFDPDVNTGLAVAEVLVSVFAGARTVSSWAKNVENEIRAGGWLARSIGVGNMVHLLVIGGILYGVTRNILGI